MAVATVVCGVLLFGGMREEASAADRETGWESPVIQTELRGLSKASLLFQDTAHRPLVALSPQRPMIPASTTKLVTAYLALRHWGASHRFKTDFKVVKRASDGAVILWVKGYGDPFLVSEALQRIARTLAESLKSQGVARIDAVYLDASYFSPSLVLPGLSATLNPYDAVPSALAANFNTLFLTTRQGQVVSAEAQTPLTPTAAKLGKQTDLTQGRFNLGQDARVGQRYFAELLSAFLRREGIGVARSVAWHGLAEADSPGLAEVVFYRHYNTLNLAGMVRPMMRYSTNFIANQLILMLAAEQLGPPATAEKVAQLMNDSLKRAFGWTDFYLEEGAGLSRANRLSAQQLVALLEAFRPWKDLLPEVETDVWAKTGTLLGVSALAGYIENDQVKSDQAWSPFALLINQPVPLDFRNRVALALKQGVLGAQLSESRLSQRPESYESAN